MDIPSPIFTAIGAILAATIAGGVTFLMAVISKDQKTSEFRQAWIDGLRGKIAEFISLFVVITDIIRVMRRQNKTEQEIIEYLMEKDEPFCKLEQADTKIKLRINPTEHSKLLATLAPPRNYVWSDQIMDSKVSDILVENIIRESQVVLKSEWKRVKRGEPAFVATKIISLSVIVLTIFSAILIWLFR